MVDWGSKIKEACRILREENSGMILLNDLVPEEEAKVVNLDVEPLAHEGRFGKKTLGKYLWDLRNLRAVRRAQTSDYPLVLWVHYEEETNTSYAGLAHLLSPAVALRWAEMNSNLEMADA